MMNKAKPKTEMCSIIDKDRKLLWTQDAYLRILMEHFMALLNGQTDSEDITYNNNTTENSNIPDKIENIFYNMLDLETVKRQMKYNKLPGYVELTTDIMKAAGPIGTQWLYRVLKRIWTENKIPETGIKELSYQSRRRETGNNVEIIKESYCQTFKICERILTNKVIREIKGKPAEELYVFRAGKTTTDLPSEIKQLIQKTRNMKRVSEGFHRL
jgi:hypothetical protein